MSLLLFCLLHILLRKKQGLYVIICKATRQVSYSYFNKANWTLKWNSELIRVYFSLERRFIFYSYFIILKKMMRKDDKVRVEKHLCLLLLATITSQVDRVWHKVKPYTIQYCALRFTFHPLHPFGLLDRLLALGVVFICGLHRYCEYNCSWKHSLDVPK